MKPLATILMLAILMLAVSNVNAQKLTDDRAQIDRVQEMNNKLAQAITEGNDEKILSFYTSDAVSLPNNNIKLNGIAEITNHQKEAREMGNKVKAVKFTSQTVKEYGTALVEVGTYDVTMEIKGGTQTMNDKGKYLTVWERQSDGSYKMAYEIWNSNENPMQRMKGEQKLSPAEKQKRLDQKEGGKTRSGEKNPMNEKKNQP